MNKSDSQFRWLIVAAAVAVLGVSYWMLGAKDRDREAAVALLQTVREEHGPRIERLKEAKKALVGLSATDPAVEQWMRGANAAIGISEDVAACLERLRAHALPETAAEKVEGRRRFRYEDEDCAYLDKTLVEVLNGVGRFSRDEIQGLRQAHLDAVLLVAKQLAEQLANALDRPDGVTGDGPSAWLRAEAAAIEAQWMQSSATSNVACWEKANAKAEQLRELANVAKGLARTLNDEQSNASGVVPVAIWLAQHSRLRAFEKHWWLCELAEAEAQLSAISKTADERVRWLGQVTPMQEARTRWGQIPDPYRQQAAKDAEDNLSTAIASDAGDFAAFQAAQAAFADATKAAAEAWLEVSLVELPARLRKVESRVAQQEWRQLESWFGADERLQPLREAAAAAAAAARRDSLRRIGVSPSDGSTADEITGYPKRVVHAQTGIEMVLIPAGEFTMGSPANEVGRSEDEKQHLRAIRKPFYIGVTEVTQTQWQNVMGNNPSKFKGDGLPVERVSWEDCQQFVQKAGNGMRLPSEAEWEYACRAGSSSPFSFGANITPQQVNYNGGYPYNGAAEGLDRERAVPVGSLPANAWGLHEMHGNVWEWCQDVYAAYPDRGTEAPNSDSGPYRVARGGSWRAAADGCRSAVRNGSSPGLSYSFRVGFRVVLAPVLVQ